MNLPSLEERISRLLALTAEDKRRCTACGTELYFVRHRNGKLAPYTADGLNHFLTCPEAHRFKKGNHAAAAKA